MTTRRSFLGMLAAVCTLTLPASGCRNSEGIRRAYDRVRPGAYLDGLRIATTISSSNAFTEGPAIDRIGRVYFTNIPASQILRWDPRTEDLSVVYENSGMANGLLFDDQGRLLVCEGLTGRLIRRNVDDQSTEVLADQFDGRSLAPPNDLTLDAAGRIYFSSRPSGGIPPREGAAPIAVYRLDPDGTLHQLLREPDVDMPNGIVVSHDDTKLYLIEAHGGRGKARHIKVFDLDEHGSISNGRVLVDFYPGRSGDGMCIDERGNLYVAGGLHSRRGTDETLDTRPGIHVIAPGGELLDYLETPKDTVTNCTFGGADLRSLYITAGPMLLHARTTIPGHHRYRPRA